MPVDSELIILCTFSSETEAAAAQAALVSFGIDCTSAADDCGHLRPSLTMANGIRLMVRRGDASLAEEVLENVPEDASSVQ
jgi:hypothetical protein